MNSMPRKGGWLISIIPTVTFEMYVWSRAVEAAKFSRDRLCGLLVSIQKWQLLTPDLCYRFFVILEIVYG
jgi:hypothetical protein